MGARVTWLGHASALVELGGERVLIDPLGRRRTREAGPYGSILITHAHVDHLNRWTLAACDRQARLIVPRGAAPIVADLGFREVREVEPGDQLALGGLDVECVATRHEPGRWRKGDAPVVAGYVLAGDGVQVHHAGDVDMSDFSLFDELGRRFRLDATLLPIGGMLPVWYYRWRRRALDRGVHIDPDTALELAQRLGARAMIPVHWGTVRLPLEPAATARRRLEAIATETGAADRIRVLAHGEGLDLAPGDHRPAR